MDQMIQALLVVAVLLSLASLALQFMSWSMHHGLVARVARLEAQQENSLTHAETMRIYERLSGLEALSQTQATTLKSIERHLLETDK